MRYNFRFVTCLFLRYLANKLTSQILFRDVVKNVPHAFACAKKLRTNQTPSVKSHDGDTVSLSRQLES